MNLLITWFVTIFSKIFLSKFLSDKLLRHEWTEFPEQVEAIKYFSALVRNGQAAFIILSYNSVRLRASWVSFAEVNQVWDKAKDLRERLLDRVLLLILVAIIYCFQTIDQIKVVKFWKESSMMQWCIYIYISLYYFKYWTWLFMVMIAQLLMDR